MKVDISIKSATKTQENVKLTSTNFGSCFLASFVCIGQFAVLPATISS
jgi:hypothetical protein